MNETAIKPKEKTISINTNEVAINTLSVSKGCSISIKYIKSDKNGIPYISILPIYEGRFEDRFKTKKPSNTQKEKLKLLKKPITINNIELMALSIYKHLYGVNNTNTIDLRSGSSHFLIRKHVSYTDNKATNIFHSMLGFNASENRAFKVNINKLTLRRFASTIASICSIHSVFPIAASIGEGAKEKERSATLLINSGNFRVLVNDYRVNTIEINPVTKSIILFAAELFVTKSLDNAPATIVSGHKIKGNSISFSHNNIPIKLTFDLNLCYLLLDAIET